MTLVSELTDYRTRLTPSLLSLKLLLISTNHHLDVKTRKPPLNIREQPTTTPINHNPFCSVITQLIITTTSNQNYHSPHLGLPCHAPLHSWAQKTHHHLTVLRQCSVVPSQQQYCHCFWAQSEVVVSTVEGELHLHFFHAPSSKNNHNSTLKTHKRNHTHIKKDDNYKKLIRRLNRKVRTNGGRIRANLAAT